MEKISEQEEFSYSVNLSLNSTENGPLMAETGGQKSLSNSMRSSKSSKS